MSTGLLVRELLPRGSRYACTSRGQHVSRSRIGVIPRAARIYKRHCCCWGIGAATRWRTEERYPVRGFGLGSLAAGLRRSHDSARRRGGKRAGGGGGTYAARKNNGRGAGQSSLTKSDGRRVGPGRQRPVDRSSVSTSSRRSGSGGGSPADRSGVSTTSRRSGSGDGSPAEGRKNSRHDRAAFADRITALLRKGDASKAHEILKGAESRKLDTIAGWNLLLDHVMREHSSEAAFKVYNAMKKRGRKPNEKTYTIMLRGYAKSPKNISLQRALSIHRSISEPNSIAKPSTIHYNAALEACARHNDMQALWKIAAQLPDSGPGAPDNITFTIILNAIKASADRDIEKLQKEADSEATSDTDHEVDEGSFGPGSGAWNHPSGKILERRASAVREAKKVWADVIHNWRSGVFMLDPPLISAMAHLLRLGGRERYFRDVLLLFRQTMGLRIPSAEWSREYITGLERLGRSARRLYFSESELQEVEAASDVPETDQNPSATTESLPEENAEEPAQDLFDPVDLEEIRQAKKKRDRTTKHDIQLPLPSNSELSHLMAAARELPRGHLIAREYWKTLTSKDGNYRVEPDPISYHEYLRSLRISRASAESLRVIRDEMVPRRMTLPKTFVIAISTCSRDRNNPNVPDIAGQLVDIMTKGLPMPEPSVLNKYIEIVRKYLSERMVPKDVDKTESEKIRISRLTSALARLEPQVQRLQDVFAPGDDGWENRPKPRKRIRNVSPRDAMPVLQGYQGLLQTILGKPFVSMIRLVPEVQTCPGEQPFENDDLVYADVDYLFH